jgi:hypothetical protein
LKDITQRTQQLSIDPEDEDTSYLRPMPSYPAQDSVTPTSLLASVDTYKEALARMKTPPRRSPMNSSHSVPSSNIPNTKKKKKHRRVQWPLRNHDKSK